jgi:hypothetical protein
VVGAVSLSIYLTPSFLESRGETSSLFVRNFPLRQRHRKVLAMTVTPWNGWRPCALMSLARREQMARYYDY